MSRRTTLIFGVVAGAVATMLVGGIAWAAIPGPGGVIQACYDSGGNLKVVNALPCPKGFTPLQWNQQGPKGDKGDTGPSMGFSVSAGGMDVVGDEGTTIVSKDVPEGNYVLTGRVWVINWNEDLVIGDCEIPGDAPGAPFWLQTAGRGFGSDEVVTFTSAIHHPGGPIALTCRGFLGQMSLISASLSGIKVNEIG
jgi:hypothetical protein